MQNKTHRLTLRIASYLEQEHVERMRNVDPRITVVYEPTLIRPSRYATYHAEWPVPRAAEAELAWRTLLAKADILFESDDTNIEELPNLAPNVRWIQATSAGIGQFARRTAYATRMPDTIFTTARGVHAQPLAEFCVLTMLIFSRNLFAIQDQQRRSHWERLAGTDLVGRTLGIVGMGKVGRRPPVWLAHWDFASSATREIPMATNRVSSTQMRCMVRTDLMRHCVGRSSWCFARRTRMKPTSLSERVSLR